MFQGEPLCRFKKSSGGILTMCTAAIGIALVLTQCPAAHASQAWGSINNFDTVNDTGDECHGFEIEIDDIHCTDITYTYDYNHYGTPKISEDDTDPLHPKVYVRYQSGKNLDGTWAAKTIIPTGPISPTQGHQFTNPSVNFGGEHFGVGYYGLPTGVKYNWLKDDGSGNLIYAGVVNISTPTFTYVAPAGGIAAQVQAAIEMPPPPEIPIFEFGDASWVKETKTSAHNNKVVELRDLVSDDPNDPNFKNWKNGEPDEVEVEWSILQTDFLAADGGAKGKLEGAAEALANGDEVVTRRYDFYKYIGPIDAETGQAVAESVGPDGLHGVGSVTYADHIDPFTGEFVNVTTDLTTVIVVGDYVGAQMAGFDAGAKIGLIDHLQDGEINAIYTSRSMVIAGTAPILTTRTGSLPDGMSFDQVTGILSGTPTVTGTFTFTVHSLDAAGGDVTKTFNLTINAVGVEPLPHFTIGSKVLPSIAGSTAGDGEFISGSDVTLVATANPEYVFLNWTDGGAIVSTSASYTFTVGINRDLVANFIPSASLTVATISAPAAGGTTSGGGTYLTGESVTVTAAANAEYGFKSWTESGAIVSTTPSYTFTVTASRNLTANFVLIAPTTLTMPAVNGAVGKKVTLSAVLKNKTTKAVLAGRSIQFSLNGASIGAPVTTNTYGKAVYSFIIPEETVLGSYITGVSFSGDTMDAPSTATSTLSVAAGSVKLTVTSISGKAGATVTLSAKLTNASSIAMVGEPLDFTLNGTFVGTAVTNTTGKAVLSYTIPVGTVLGIQTLIATFNGDADHTSASKAGSLTVK